MLFHPLVLSVRAIEAHAKGVERDARAQKEAPHPSLAPPPTPEFKVQIGVPRRLQEPTWPAPQRVSRLYGSLALLLTLLFASIFFLNLGMGSQDLGEAGRSMEWLFTFPVRTEGLFLAKLGEYALSDLATWYTFAPFLTVLYWRAGFGGWALLIAPLLALGIAMILAALRLTSETWLRRHLSRSRLKNVQATASIVGMLGLFGVLYLCLEPPDLVFGLGRWMPTGLLALPWLSPQLALLTPWAFLLILFWAVCIPLASLTTAARQVKSGLVDASGGPFQGTRGPTRAQADRGRCMPWVRGVARKDLTLLLRDRNLLVQTIVVPLLILGFEFLVNKSWRSGNIHPTTAVVLAFATGAYILMFGGMSVLMVEQKSIWLLYTLPQSLGTLLRQKVRLWGSVAAFFVGCVLAILWRPSAALDLDTCLRPLFAVVGVWLLAYVAAGFGTLGTDPFKQDKRKPANAQWTYLYMLVASGLGYSLSAASLWSIFVALTLVASLSWAIWSKVDQRLLVLIDPVARVRRRLSLADGLIAIVVFFLVQGALFSAMLLLEAPLPLAIALSYSLAGLLTLIGTNYALAKIKDLRTSLGLPRSKAPGNALATGLFAGVAAGVFALGWLFLVDRIPALRNLRDTTPDLITGSNIEVQLLLFGLLVGAAPYVEEWLFRGFLYGGMRQMWGPRRSTLASALIFAIVHPALGFPAVFGLGVATAIARERTRVLWPAMIAHGTYNAMVLLAAYLR